MLNKKEIEKEIRQSEKKIKELKQHINNIIDTEVGNTGKPSDYFTNEEDRFRWIEWSFREIKFNQGFIKKQKENLKCIQSDSKSLEELRKDFGPELKDLESFPELKYKQN